MPRDGAARGRGGEGKPEGRLGAQGLWQVHGPRVFERSRSGIQAPLGSGNGTLVVESRGPDGLGEEDAEVLAHWAASLVQALEAFREREREAQAAVTEERQRIARDLHDRVNQRLFSASLAVSSAVSLREAGRCSETGASLDLARSQLRLAQEEMRALVHALRPERAETSSDLGETFRELAHSLEAVEGPRIEAHVGSVPEGVRPEVRTALVHIASEALHNAVRHARASRVQLSLAVRGSVLELDVADDGVGLRVRAHAEGMGLSSMRRRAREVCGSVRIGPVQGRETRAVLDGGPPARPGTRVRARIPVLGCREEPEGPAGPGQPGHDARRGER